MTDALRGAYRVMRTIRAVADRVGTGDPGEEALAVGVCLHLDERDAIAGTHRQHSRRIAKGVDVRAVVAEVRKHRRPVAADALGGVPLLICGAAIAAQQRDTGGVGVAFLGDCPTTTLEALNLASAWHLPAIFVTEDPGYADRVAGLGVPGVVVDGSDFFAVHEAAGEAVGRARDGGGPTLIEAGFPRHVEDCLQRFRTRVTDSGELREQVLDAIDAEVARLVEDSVAAPEPAPPDLETGVYVTY
ncbi:pyruvate dehydrogenase E1 component alpha subunit [Amycolatopsis tolypomycina]|uniref:Pyruvate dehydrogenase E1 component alpha subunit n=1 Tax=Amycolatopsis tolypomycina TaxID=208445 RepID=A0A1H4JPR6_9PSEU|nr:thiamine pyrophosphate-dependent enzyme [Amycolatopsis tolypomycina]SEB48300.1 pyruvate dehydrogenase E1 component alpha subunit [Amycolatopsis tolypomycina]